MCRECFTDLNIPNIPKDSTLRAVQIWVLNIFELLFFSDFKMLFQERCTARRAITNSEFLESLNRSSLTTKNSEQTLGKQKKNYKPHLNKLRYQKVYWHRIIAADN